jgi:hypothetical protein
MPDAIERNLFFLPTLSPARPDTYKVIVRHTLKKILLDSYSSAKLYDTANSTDKAMDENKAILCITLNSKLSITNQADKIPLSNLS